MRQIGPGARALSLADAMRLPGAARRGGRNHLVIGLHHQWVLHRQLIVRVLALFACALVLAVGFHARGGIVLATQTLGNVLSGRFAAAGFNISAIEFSGQSITSEDLLVEALGLNAQSTTLTFNAEAARDRILALPAIKSATVRKIYPGQLIVDVTEKEPVARWTVDGVTYLVDRFGERLGPALPVDEGLPLVIGAGAADDALVMVRALENFPALSEGLLAVSRIADRRWDMLYDTGLRVKLPESGVNEALNLLQTYQSAHRLMDRDVSIIDLRVRGSVAVQLNQRDEEKT